MTCLEPGSLGLTSPHIVWQLASAPGETKLFTEHDPGQNQGPTGLQWAQAPGFLTRTGRLAGACWKTQNEEPRWELTGEPART